MKLHCLKPHHLSFQFSLMKEEGKKELCGVFFCACSGSCAMYFSVRAVELPVHHGETRQANGLHLFRQDRGPATEMGGSHRSCSVSQWDGCEKLYIRNLFYTAQFDIRVTLHCSEGNDTIQTSSSSAFPSYISEVRHFGWDFCVCDRFFKSNHWCSDISSSWMVRAACWVCFYCGHSLDQDMNVRIFWAHSMEYMGAQTRPQFILSSERVFREWSQNPMLTPRENSHLPEKFSPEEDGTHNAASNRTASPTCYQQAIPPSPPPPPPAPPQPLCTIQTNASYADFVVSMIA